MPAIPTLSVHYDVAMSSSRFSDIRVSITNVEVDNEFNSLANRPLKIDRELPKVLFRLAVNEAIESNPQWDDIELRATHGGFAIKRDTPRTDSTEDIAPYVRAAYVVPTIIADVTNAATMIVMTTMAIDTPVATRMAISYSAELREEMTIGQRLDELDYANGTVRRRERHSLIVALPTGFITGILAHLLPNSWMIYIAMLGWMVLFYFKPTFQAISYAKRVRSDVNRRLAELRYSHPEWQGNQPT